MGNIFSLRYRHCQHVAPISSVLSPYKPIGNFIMVKTVKMHKILGIDNVGTEYPIGVVKWNRQVIVLFFH
jgi:hypothetical protein